MVLHLATPEFLAFTCFQESKFGVVVEESLVLKKDACYAAYERATEVDGEGLGNQRMQHREEGWTSGRDTLTNE